MHGRQVGSGEGVEHVALRRGRRQGPVFVLAVDLDQGRGRLAQCRHGGHAPVHPGAGAARGGHGAGEDDLLGVIRFGAGCCDHAASLDQRLGCSGAHHGRAGPPAQHELERLDQERLAGTRLARQRGHARTEGERQVLDHPEVPHA